MKRRRTDAVSHILSSIPELKKNKHNIVKVMVNFILLYNIEFVGFFFSNKILRDCSPNLALNIDAVLNLSDRVLGDVKINSFTTLPGKARLQ